MTKPKIQKPGNLYAQAFIFFGINLLLFCGIFIIAFYLMKNKLHLQAVDVPLIKTGFDHGGLDLIVMIKNRTPLIGAGLGLAFSLFLLILMLVFTKLRRKSKIVNPILFICALVPFSLTAIDLLFLEQRFSAIGSALMSFVGVPLGITLIGLFLFNMIWFAIQGFAKTVNTAVLLLVLGNLTGCGLSTDAVPACQFNPDSDHCYQAMAVQSGKHDTCEKIKGESFEGQNPPKDKCYLMVAVNLGKYEVCDKIEGGFNSYSKEQCQMEVAIGKKDAARCRTLQNPEMAAECAGKIPTEGDNPLKENEKPVAKVTKLNGDIRIIKEDGRVIPLTQDSILGPNDRISSFEESTYTIEIFGKGSHEVSQNTVLSMNSEEPEFNMNVVTGVR